MPLLIEHPDFQRILKRTKSTLSFRYDTSSYVNLFVKLNSFES